MEPKEIYIPCKEALKAEAEVDKLLAQGIRPTNIEIEIGYYLKQLTRKH